MSNPYGKEYFTSVNYSDYLDRRDRYLKIAREFSEIFQKLEIVSKSSLILDYGCAVGFLMEGLIEVGYNNVVGYDISEWAVNNARGRGLTVLEEVRNRPFDMGFFMDVLEHMSDAEITELFSSSYFRSVIVRIPCACASAPDDFFLSVSRKDKTHVNCKTKEGWIAFFGTLGYHYFRLNMNTVYDSRGVFCALFIK